MARINVFENFARDNIALTLGVNSNNAQMIHGVYFPGSISFNDVALIASVSNTVDATLTVRFGLYSLNGSTLSLANSASNTIGTSGNLFSWITLVTSATQDITPGNWWLAFGFSRTGAGLSFSIVGNSRFQTAFTHVYGGPFIRGFHSGTSTVMPATIATSNITKEGLNLSDSMNHPYILISA